MSADATLIVAKRLVELCQNQQPTLDELYAEDVVSVEAMAMPGETSAAVSGLAAVRQKHAWWEAGFEVHSGTVEGPFPHGEDRFAVIFEFDATERASGQRWKMKEVGVYTVAAGKIVREEFFYASN